MEIDSFSTLESCVNKHASLDPLVGDALEAIGYDTLLSDSCHLLEAAKARNPTPCSAVQASPLRGRCISLVAELTGQPEGCPWRVDSQRALGREPACLALASGDGRLCAGVPDRNARALCFAVARHSAEGCAEIPVPVEKARCQREAERWGSVIPSADRKKEGGPLIVSGRFFLTPPTDGASSALAARRQESAPIEVDLTGELRTGVVLVRRFDETRLRLGPMREADDDFVPPSPLALPTVAFDLTVPLSTSPKLQTAGPRLERIQVRVPSHPIVRYPPSISTVVPTVTTLELRRGGLVEVSVEGEIRDARGTWHLQGEAKTFVRDIVTEGASPAEMR